MKRQTNKEACYQIVRILNSQGFSCTLDNNDRRLKLTNKDQSRNISPLMAPREMHLYLSGFLDAVEEMIHEANPSKGLTSSSSLIEKNLSKKGEVRYNAQDAPGFSRGDMGKGKRIYSVYRIDRASGVAMAYCESWNAWGQLSHDVIPLNTLVTF